MVFGYIIPATFLVSLISLTGSLFIWLKEKTPGRFIECPVSFAVDCGVY